MSGPWFGALYRQTTEDLLTPRLSRLEAEVIATLLRLGPGERVLDVACGMGRHLAALRGRGLRLVGVDRDMGSLRDAIATIAASAAGDKPPPYGARFPAGNCGPATSTATPAATPTATSTATGVTLVRADFRALPFGTAFDAAYAWYSSLFLGDDRSNLAALAEAGRVLRPGGRLLVQHANPARLAADPEADSDRLLPGGGRCRERSRFDARTGLETLSRTLERGGRVLAGTVQLRYYRPIEWEALAPRAGLRLSALASTGAGAPAPCSDEALDLIAVLEKPT